MEHVREMGRSVRVVRYRKHCNYCDLTAEYEVGNIYMCYDHLLAVGYTPTHPQVRPARREAV